jgi:predicted phosphoribosyltransferase
MRRTVPLSKLPEANAKHRELAGIERRRRLYLGAAQPIDVKGHLAIVVDDGIATGVP